MEDVTQITDRAQRLYVELVCRKEEAEGHPGIAPEAEAQAIKSGGSFAERIRLRAVSLPDAEHSMLQVQQVLRTGRQVLVGALLIAAFLGVAAASSALQGAGSVSLPMILLTLIGVNLASLVLWLMFQLLGRRSGGLIRSIWQKLSARFVDRANIPKGQYRFDLASVAELTTGRGGRWRLGVMTHAVWLAYTFAGLLSLTVLLVVSRYELSWQTTLLSPEGLHAWADKMSYAPRLLGAAGPDVLPLNGELSAEHRQGWAIWMLLAVVSYSLLPRLIALVLCWILAAREQASWARDLSRPGFARLRARLMPDHSAVSVIDADESDTPSANFPDKGLAVKLPESGLFAVFLERAGEERDADLTWLDPVEDAASLQKAVEEIQAGRPSGLLVFTAATATPDRGTARVLARLVQTADVPVWLVLTALPQLKARGTPAFHTRVADWSATAQRAGVQGGVIAWDDRRLLDPVPEAMQQ